MALGCSICDAVFDNRDELDEHEQLHQQLDCLSRDIANYELHSPMSFASSTNSPLHCKKPSPLSNDKVSDVSTNQVSPGAESTNHESSADENLYIQPNENDKNETEDIVKEAFTNAGLATVYTTSNDGASIERIEPELAMEYIGEVNSNEFAKDTGDSGLENSDAPVDFSPVTSPPMTSTHSDPSELTVNAMAAALGLTDPIVSLDTLPPPFITRHSVDLDRQSIDMDGESIDLDFLGPNVTVPKAKPRRNRVRKPTPKVRNYSNNKRVPRRFYSENTEIFDLVAYPVSYRKTDPVRDRLMERVGKLNSDLLTKVVSMNRGILTKILDMDTTLLRKLTSMDEDVLESIMNIDREVLTKIAEMDPSEVKAKLSRNNVASNDWKLNVQPMVLLNRVSSNPSQKLTRAFMKKNSTNRRGRVPVKNATNEALLTVTEPVVTKPGPQRTKPKLKRRQKWTMKRRPSPTMTVKDEEPEIPEKVRSKFALKTKRGHAQPEETVAPIPTKRMPKLVLKMKRKFQSKQAKSRTAKPYSRTQTSTEGVARSLSKRLAARAPKEILDGQILSRRQRRNCTLNKKYTLEETLDNVQKTADIVTSKRPGRERKKAKEISNVESNGWDANMNEETRKDLIACCTSGKVVVMVSKIDETEVRKVKNDTGNIFNDDDSSMDGILTADFMAQLDKFESGEIEETLCDLCGDEPENPIEHSKDHKDNSSPYQCGLCSLYFTERSQYERHIRSYHYKEEHLQCPYCKCTFKSLNLARFEAHIRAQHGDEHESERIGMKQFACQFCESKFDSSSTYRMHCNSHSEKENYSCDKCNVTSHDVDEYRRHLDEHLNDQESRERDSQPLVQYDDISNNSEVVSNDAEVGNSNDDEIEKTVKEVGKICEFCGFVTVSEFQRHLHLILKHSNISCKCPFCVLVCDSQENLQRHLTEMHPKYHNNMCPHCGALFENNDELKDHRKKHRTRFSCHPCGTKFATRIAHIQHRISHHSKNLKCASCALSFPSRIKFSRHRCRSKSIPCQDCDQTFETLNDLKFHLMNEHLKMPLNVVNPPKDLFLHYCTICSEGFSFKRHLKRHHAEMHSENGSLKSNGSN